MTEGEGAAAPLRFGLVGCGVIGQTHAAAVAGLEGARLAAVADPVSERASSLAQRHGVPAYADLAAMLAGEEIDVVTVCTASGLHGEIARAAMLAGKHVVVEKPLEISLSAIDDLIAVQRRQGVEMATISQHRFDPATRQVHALLAVGEFGRPVLANAQILWWRSQEYYDSGGWRGTWALDGGGVLMNQSIHSIDLLQWFMGPVRSVQAYTGTLAHRMETEDTAAATLHFASGALGSIAATTAAYPGVATRLEVLGSAGSAVIENDRLRYLELRSEDGEAVGLYGRADAQLEDTPLGSAGSRVPEGDAHALQLAAIVRAIHRGETPPVDAAAARHAVAIILAIYESARTGREVSVR